MVFNVQGCLCLECYIPAASGKSPICQSHNRHLESCLPLGDMTKEDLDESPPGRTVPIRSQ
jgi:hypothetical protein